MDDAAVLERHAAALASAAALVDHGPAADADTAAGAGVGEGGLGVGAHGVLAAAVADVADNALAVVAALEVRGDAGVTLLKAGREKERNSS